MAKHNATTQRRPGFFSRENIKSIIIAVVLALFIRQFIVQAFKIPSGSMEPTLLIGDHLLVNKFCYGFSVPFVDQKIVPFSTPQRGDVVVFVFPLAPDKDFIKRVVAVAGDRVEIRNTQLLINGAVAADPHAVYRDSMRKNPHAPDGARDHVGPVTVPPGHIFVMGDNRDHSYDSRFWGFVDVNRVKGKAFIIYWSWERLFHNFRFRRIGTIIH